jgi:hypothetical protein
MMKAPAPGSVRLPALFLLGKCPYRKFHEYRALVFAKDINPAQQCHSIFPGLNNITYLHPFIELVVVRGYKAVNLGGMLVSYHGIGVGL